MRALVVFFIFYVSLGGYLFFNQERMIYLPAPHDMEDCPALSEAEIVSVDGTRMYVQEGVQGMVVLYHGNAGSACNRAFYTQPIREAGFGYVLVEYAGYSNDQRQPSHALVKQDVQNVIVYLAQGSYEPILIIGESLGAGVAGYHVSRKAPDGVLLITPFDSLPRLAQHHYWYYPARWLVEDAFNATQTFSAYSGHVTIVHGSNDRIVPTKFGYRVYEGLQTEDKQFVEVENAGHNNLFLFEETWDTLRYFLQTFRNEG